MWLKNYYNAMLYGLMPAASYNALPSDDFSYNECVLKNYSGVLDKGINIATHYSPITSGTGLTYSNLTSLKPIDGLAKIDSATHTFMVFSSDTANVDDEDYCFTNIVSNLTFSTPGLSQTVSSSGVIVQYAFTITNNNASDVTIGTVGLVESAVSYPDSTKLKYVYMFYKEKLSTPITIAAGTSVTYVQDFGYPLSVPN